MDSEWGLIGTVLTALLATVGYLGRYILRRTEDELRAMTEDRNWYRDRYLSLLAAVDEAIREAK